MIKTVDLPVGVVTQLPHNLSLISWETYKVPEAHLRLKSPHTAMTLIASLMGFSADYLDLHKLTRKLV